MRKPYGSQRLLPPFPSQKPAFRFRVIAAAPQNCPAPRRVWPIRREKPPILTLWGNSCFLSGARRAPARRRAASCRMCADRDRLVPSGRNKQEHGGFAPSYAPLASRNSQSFHSIPATFAAHPFRERSRGAPPLHCLVALFRRTYQCLLMLRLWMLPGLTCVREYPCEFFAIC